MTATQLTIAGQPVPPWWAASVALIESLPDTYDGRQMALHVILGLMPAVPVDEQWRVVDIQAEMLAGALSPTSAAYRLDSLTDEVAS